MVSECALPQNALWHDDSCFVNFWREIKNNSVLCAKLS